MPYQWTAERERRMLLLAISSANLRPSAETWTKVAGALGDGLSASAVSQKYYKLQKESARYFAGQSDSSAPSTPTKRKANQDEEDEKKTPPSKRARHPKREPLDGVPFSDASDSPPELKAEGLDTTILDPYSFGSYDASFMTAGHFLPVNIHSGHVKGEESGGGNGSFMTQTTDGSSFAV